MKQSNEMWFLHDGITYSMESVNGNFHFCICIMLMLQCFLLCFGLLSRLYIDSSWTELETYLISLYNSDRSIDSGILPIWINTVQFLLYHFVHVMLFVSLDNYYRVLSHNSLCQSDAFSCTFWTGKSRDTALSFVI